MKKFILCAAVVAAAVFGVIKANELNNNMTDLQMENVEALARRGDASGPCCVSSSGYYCFVFDGYDLIFQQAGYACGGCPITCFTAMQ